MPASNKMKLVIDQVVINWPEWGKVRLVLGLTNLNIVGKILGGLRRVPDDDDDDDDGDDDRESCRHFVGAEASHLWPNKNSLDDVTLNIFDDFHNLTRISKAEKSKRLAFKRTENKSCIIIFWPSRKHSCLSLLANKPISPITLSHSGYLKYTLIYFNYNYRTLSREQW